MDAAALLRLWVAAYSKWPPAVEAWMAGHSGLGVSAGPRADEAEEWSRVGEEVVQSLGGKNFDAMHVAIAVGRMASMMGAQIFFQKLGQLQLVANPLKRKRAADTQVLLGKLQHKFLVKPCADAWKEIFETCSDVEPVRAPEDVEQLRTTIQHLNAWLKGFPQRFSLGGSAADDGKLEAGYIRKHILRKFVLALTKKVPKHVSSALLWKDTLCAVPDRGCHTSDVDGSASWGKIEAEYGMQPLLISCWACLFHAVPKESLERHFRRPGPKLLEAAVELKSRNGYAPSPAMLAEHLTV